jgi:hypothetical protein
MERGAFNMMPKASDEVCNGNSRHPRDLRKLACENRKLRQRLSLPSVSRLLFTLNSFHEAKQSTKPIWI